MKFLRTVWFLALVASVGCDGEHAHDEHGHGHEAEGHGDHGAHDDHGDHEEGESWTNFAEQTQLFAEYDVLEAGKPAKFRLHLTQLRGWLAVRDGKVTVELQWGNDVVTSEPAQAVRPGIYELTVAVPSGVSGEGVMRVKLASERVNDTHEGPVEVHGADGEHEHADAPHSHDEPITFLLEQQWSIDFGMAPAVKRRIRSSFEAYGTIKAALGGEGVVHAPVAGRVVGDDLPMLGSTVEKGQELAWLVPALADQGDLAGLDLALSQAEVQLRAAQSQTKRLEGLVRDGVVPERRLTDARFAEEQARASLGAARRRMGQAKGASGSRTRRGQGSVTLAAPLSGVVVAVDVPPGLYIDAGHPLFRIVDPDPLWLEVAIPEVHIPLLQGVTGVWFEVEGFDEPFEVTDTRVSVGGAVDTASRTLPVTVEVPNPDGKLRPGMFANAHVIDGELEERLAIPVTSLVRVDGLSVAFVGVDGETFQRRPLRLGARDGEFVEVRSGLEPGDWVVTDGAFAIRLAGLGDQSNAGHGHAH